MTTDSLLNAFQLAFRKELQAAIHGLPVRAEGNVLDCPCGGGFYTALWASRLPSGTLVAADNSPACLEQTSKAIQTCTDAVSVRLVQADIYRLPFEDASFDYVWCAQSFITLDDPVAVLRELARVTRLGGRIAVLETDEYHHVLLPWPVELELAVFRGVRAASRRRYGSASKLVPVRSLREAFLDAGWVPAGRTTVVADRSAPFEAATREFLQRYLEHLRGTIRDDLTSQELATLDALINPADPESLGLRAGVELTCLATICHAER